MLSYLDTVGRLTDLRDSVRMTLASETADRQMGLEGVETTLNDLLGKLVTPSATCHLCGAIAIGIATDTGEGVCADHLLGTLLTGRAVNVSPEALANLNVH